MKNFRDRVKAHMFVQVLAIIISCSVLYDCFKKVAWIESRTGKYGNNGDSNVFRVDYFSRNNPKGVTIEHKGINCMMDKGYNPVSYVNGEVKNESQKCLIKLSIDPTYKFKQDCNECKAKTTLNYKSLFGSNIKQEIFWNKEN